ncbi:hypothetical protein J4558_14035 [Leptolyngbya sp. 15MV]|nr:hypothetical protein J4558_14035 [Leptolyngbya sp. 15MV]
MNLIKRLLRREADPKSALRPLWHRTVELSRDPDWYARCGVHDTVQGRFDMITLVLGMVLLRMEREDALKPGSVYLTELFVDDIDGQLRETGMGDPTLGKQMGRLVSVLGGRLGALRDAGHDEAALAEVVTRNAAIEGDGLAVARRLIALAANLDRADAGALLAGNVTL